MSVHVCLLQRKSQLRRVRRRFRCMHGPYRTAYSTTCMLHAGRACLRINRPARSVRSTRLFVSIRRARVTTRWYVRASMRPYVPTRDHKFTLLHALSFHDRLICCSSKGFGCQWPVRACSCNSRALASRCARARMHRAICCRCCCRV